MSRLKLLLICLVLVTVFSGLAEPFNCLLCNSVVTPACLQDPKTDGINTCPGEECYTYMNGTTLYRGCTKPELDCNDEKICSSCNTEKCNVETFPKDRIKCFDCVTDCATIPETKEPKFCKKPDDQCYTSVANETSIKRGCAAEDNYQCTDGNCCENCGCNKENAIQTVHCLACDSDESNKCKRPDPITESCKIQEAAGKCEEKVLLGKKPQCYTYFKNDSVKRGCSNTKPDVPESDLKVCNADMCNSDCIPDAKCYECDSSLKPDCQTEKLKDFEKECPAFIGSCYLCETVDGKKVTRGCGSNKNEELVCSNCRDKDLCNANKLSRSCYVCNSETDPKCATNPDKKEFCTEGDECMVRLSDSGATIRSCKGKRDCKSELSCTTCKEHNCNKDVLVKDNLSCYSCNGGTDCLSYQNVTEKLITCSNVVKNNKCYMFSADGGKTMKRGCASDTDAPADCKTNDVKCLKCEGDGCNSRGYLSKSGLKCVQCSTDDEKCVWRYDRNSATECTVGIEYYKSDSCFLHTSANGSITRGCSSDDKVGCTNENEQCRRCYTDGCNTQSNKSWSCARCRSDNDGQAKCKDSGDGFSKTPCTNVPTFETRGCYTENWYGIIIRGCLTDLDPFDMANCRKTNYKWCEACNTEDCNHIKLNSSTNLQGTFYIVVLCYVLFLFNF